MPGENAGIATVVIVAVIAVAYLLIFVFPSFTGSGEKPALGEGELVEPKHIDWLVKELGAGTLHAIDPEGSPEIEFLVKPQGSYFTVNIENGVPITTSGRANDPDIRLTGNREVVARLLAAEDLLGEVKKLSEEGEVKLDVLKDNEALAAMGYSRLYDDLTE